MAIVEHREEYGVYCTGWLQRDGTPSDDARPQDLAGVVKNECGLAYVSVAYMGRLAGPWKQHLRAETVRDGRSHTLWRESTEPDWLTERGIKTVVGRWLREL